MKIRDRGISGKYSTFQTGHSSQDRASKSGTRLLSGSSGTVGTHTVCVVVVSHTARLAGCIINTVCIVMELLALELLIKSGCVYTGMIILNNMIILL